MKHMKKKPNSQDECGFGERGGIIVCGLLPPPRAVPLPRRGRSWGIRRSKPAALPSIGYRGFAVAPMTLRAPARNLVYNPGCRVATLLVSKGVMGFLGDLRGKNRNFPLIPRPSGASFTPSTAAAVPLPRRGRSWGFAGQGLSALLSIAYRGFAVAPMTLRASARRVIITSGINGRAMRAPTGDGGATDGCKYI